MGDRTLKRGRRSEFLAKGDDAPSALKHIGSPFMGKAK
jgi:hypothetical protein